MKGLHGAPRGRADMRGSACLRFPVGRGFSLQMMRAAHEVASRNRKHQKAGVCASRTTLVSLTLSMVLAFPVIAFPSAPDASPARPAASLDGLIAKVRASVNPGEAMEIMREVYSTDRWFNFEKFAQTAEYLKGAMLRVGLRNVEIGQAPADGMTQVGFWTMPMAWDVKRARLEIVDPSLPPESSLLADYNKVPTSLCEWSGSTPPGGITADVVEVENWPAAKIARMDLHGKIAMTDENPADIKWALVKSGALGVINTFSEEPSLQDARQWVNAWGDNGWAFTKTSTPLPCFSITTRQAAEVRRLIALRGRVQLKATVEARLYAGIYPFTTGVIPGTGPEEVLGLGHTGEEGAGDNASGVAALVEAMTTLERLISSGQLPRPARTIRVLLMPEMYDSMYYIDRNRERIRRTVAAFCLDTPAEGYDLAGSFYTFYMNPGVASSYTDAFILKVAESYFSKIGRSWHWHVFGTGTDSYLGDPTIGVPTVWAYSGNDVYTPHHSSADTPARVDARSLRDLTVVTAAYLYYLANAEGPEARWLASLSQTRGYQQILNAASPFLDKIARAEDEEALGKHLAVALEKIRYTVDRQRQAVSSVLPLAPEVQRERVRVSVTPLSTELAQFGEAQSERIRTAVEQRADSLAITHPIRPIAATDPEMAVASTIVVKRRRFGTIPLDDLPPDRREGYPSGAWDLVPITALYWSDGHRNLADVIHLTQMELGSTHFDFVGYFRFLRRHGYVEFVKGE